MSGNAPVVPYAVVRANNLPLGSLAALTGSRQAAALLASLQAARAELDGMREHTCALLFALAAGAGADYRRLVEAKRAIHGAAAPAEVLARHGQLLERHPCLHGWLRQARNVVRLEAQVLASMDEAIAGSRAAARALVRHPAFLQAMSMTRGDMHRLALDYAQDGPAPGKKGLNDEETLFRYLTRAIAKVSPFSSFTSVGFAVLADGAAPAAGVALAPGRRVEDRFSLDRSALLKLFERFVIRHAGQWHFRLSSNHRQVGAERHFYLFGDRPEVYPYRTCLIKTRMAADSPFAAGAADGWLSWQAFTALLPAGADGRAVLGKWLAAGMLNYRPRLDDEDPDLLAGFLAIARNVAESDPAARDVAGLLERLHGCFARLAGAAPPDGEPRRAAVAALNAGLRELAQLLECPLVKREGLVYHDSYLPDLPALPGRQLRAYAAQLGEFVAHYLGCNFNSGYPDAVLADLRAALGARRLSVFDFHELVQQTVAAHRDAPSRPEARTLPLLALYDEVWARRDEAEIVLAPAPAHAGARRASFAAYGHLGAAGFVVNNIDSGYLRCYSRFFTLPRSDDVLGACRSAYGGALADAYDVYDTFGFNTAYRPRLCGNRLWLDAPERARGADLALSALHVSWPAGAALPVLDAGGRTVRLRQTGLFVKELYPRLLETLMRFAMADAPCYFAFRFGLHKRVADAGAAAGGVVRIARVRYRDLVLSREQWWVGRAGLPQRAHAEDAGRYFLRLNAWRCAHALPQRVFLRRHHAGKVLERDISNLKKPVLLDFASPIMARMIGRMFAAGFDLASFEEALPDPGQADAHACATEIIFETTAGRETDMP